MTEETRAKLRQAIECLVSAADVASSVSSSGPRRGYGIMAADVFVYWPDTATLPDLTTAQQLALSVLVGDESVLPQALADFMIDQGHEYAAALAEKTRTEERRRVAAFIEIWRNYMGNSMTDRLLIELDGRHIEGMAASTRFPYPGFTETRDRGSGAGGCDVE